uniref:adenylate/guanylate cyclase domain-containing protein n=1 Tax=Sedimenticola sp. TaxID=1940285 RepID=UPI003D096838
ELLNCHFDKMTDVIFENRGTLDKFIGDAIMAFWGAPVRVANHADLAMKAALGMVEGLEVVNAQLAGKNYPQISIGIGIHTGEVILGNIGSERKLDYTVIGDNVNLASRLEGLTKQYGFPIVVSEQTVAAITSDMAFAVLDQVRVKGKTGAVKIYAPLTRQTSPVSADQAADQVQWINQGFEHYLARRWEEAAACYRQVENPTLREVYLQRCQKLSAEGIPHNWDGIYSLSTK